MTDSESRKMRLPKRYSRLKSSERRIVREEYIKRQEGKCFYCGHPLSEEAPKEVRRVIDWSLFPPNFLRYPIHLQHNHDTDMTEGAVHNICNAIMWQYEGR